MLHSWILQIILWDSAFRYGLPVNFQAILIQPNKKSMKRLRDQLNQLYGHLDGSAGSGAGGNSDVSIFVQFGKSCPIWHHVGFGSLNILSTQKSIVNIVCGFCWQCEKETEALEDSGRFGTSCDINVGGGYLHRTTISLYGRSSFTFPWHGRLICLCLT